MIPIAASIRRAVRGSAAAVWRPRFRLRGWKGSAASPVADLTEILNRLPDGCPVVLVGHSMGARAALWAAGHPLVIGVAALAPWLPPGDPVDQLAGRRVLLAHGSADTTTSPSETWAYARRAQAVGQVAALEVRRGEHTMLRRARLWHHLAAEFTCSALGLPGIDQELCQALIQAARQPVRLAV
jgi:pimeloyl-ACP methyl ester carboxylesterase